MVTKLTEPHIEILDLLSALTIPHGGLCVGFTPIIQYVKMDRAKVRRIVRFLSRHGYAEYHKGLWTDDGQPAGAGYCITPEGIKKLEEKGI